MAITSLAPREKARRSGTVFCRPLFNQRKTAPSFSKRGKARLTSRFSTGPSMSSGVLTVKEGSRRGGGGLKWPWPSLWDAQPSWACSVSNFRGYFPSLCGWPPLVLGVTEGGIFRSTSPLSNSQASLRYLKEANANSRCYSEPIAAATDRSHARQIAYVLPWPIRS